MKRVCHVEIDHENNIATVTKSFLKEAETIGSPAYEELVELRKNHPGLKVKVRTIAKNEDKISYDGLTYEYMEEFIKAQEGDNAAAALAEFKKTKELSKAYRAPYLFVRNWFLKKYWDVLPYKDMKKKDDSLDDIDEDMNGQNVLNTERKNENE